MNKNESNYQPKQLKPGTREWCVWAMHHIEDLERELAAVTAERDALAHYVSVVHKEEHAAKGGAR